MSDDDLSKILQRPDLIHALAHGYVANYDDRNKLAGDPAWPTLQPRDFSPSLSPYDPQAGRPRPELQEALASYLPKPSDAYGLAGLATTAAMDAGRGKYDPETLAPLAAMAFMPGAKRGGLIPAVTIDGKIFAKGPTHAEAIGEWIKTRGNEGIPPIESLYKEGRLVDGFTSPDGRFLDRKEAASYAGMPPDRWGLESLEGRGKGIVGTDHEASPLVNSLAQRLEALPQAPRREILPSDVPLNIDPPAGLGDRRYWMARNPSTRSEIAGGVSAREIPGERAIRIEGTEIPRDDRGEGIGVAVYQRLIDQAHKRGYAVQSDSVVSPDAQKIYEALVQRGYRVERHPEAVDAGREGGGKLIGPKGEPVFTVHPPTGMTPEMRAILEKYGILGPAALGAAANTLSPDKVPQQ